MKKLLFILLVSISISAFAQEKTTGSTSNSQEQPAQKRTAASSVKAESSPLPYDVNDKYMGRKEEFLNNLIVSALPADFPLYNKKMSLTEYNQVVDNFYKTHTGILKEAVKQKLSQK